MMAVHPFVWALGLQLWSVRQWDGKKKKKILTVGDFLKILYQATSKRFRVLKIYFMLDVPKYVSRVVFKGGILGGVRQFWSNPYLNSTTVLFDYAI